MDPSSQDLQDPRPHDEEDNGNDDGAQQQSTTFEEQAKRRRSFRDSLRSLATVMTTTALFSSMMRRPWLFIAFAPTLWIVFAAIGWSKEDKVEDQVYRIWTEYRSDYRKDQDYADSLGSNNLGSTAFFGLAVSRDDGNMFTPKRLDEVKARMEMAEATTIEYKGHTIGWQDVCGSNSVGPGTSYEFPCSRLTPMDFFQEANWFFREVDRLTWYNNLVVDIILKPRLERFGILQGVCSDLQNAASGRKDCNHVISLRSSEQYAVSQGYPASYANPLNLFGDIGNLEMNDPCKICIETEFENTMDTLEATTRGSFQVMSIEAGRAIQAFVAANPDTPVDPQLQTFAANAKSISENFTRQDAIDFFVYTTIRQLYAAFGGEPLTQSYSAFASPELMGACASILGAENCATSISLPEAQKMLLDHADHAFSSRNTGGVPLPFWSEETETTPAIMFGGTSPVSGSGLDLSGTSFSLTAYFDVANFNPAAFGDTWNPMYADGNTVMGLSDPMFVQLVETDPVYKWFTAGVTPAKDTHCDNQDIMGTAVPAAVPGAEALNMQTAAAMKATSPRWCTKFNEPNVNSTDTTTEYTVQHFARMWYDLVIDSPAFLGLTQGTSDPYLWTTGQGCGYTLGGQRATYTGKESDIDAILKDASGQLYYIDEGSSLGPVDRNLLLGGTNPPIAEYSPDNPLKSATVLSQIYVALLPVAIAKRVANCNRPGGPINITEAEAEQILFDYKKAFEESWSTDWDNGSAGEVQFVGFYDDQGVVGTTGRLLKEITLDNGTLVAVSIVLLALFSALFLLDCDVVESRVLITTIGVALVILAFFAAVGFGLMCGIKINITIGWTLPFVMLGLGVDDMYIVLLALKKQGGYTEENFRAAMKEVIVPVSMTSMVNASMFAILNISDVPAIYLTARVALISVVFLYLTIIFCFPAYCWLDMKRQAAGRYDVVCCQKREGQDGDGDIDGDENEDEKEGATEGTSSHRAAGHLWASFIYDRFYKPLLLGDSAPVRIASHTFVWISTGVLLGLAIWGITERDIGLGLEDFFPDGHQAKHWATIRTEELASWSVGINWGALNYSDPMVQMKMVKQFEDVIESPHVAQSDTDQLWMADLQLWASRHCTHNFDREDPLTLECGMDQIYPKDNSTCSATWLLNSIGRRDKIFSEPDQCSPYKGGICRPTEWMHKDDLAQIGETLQDDDKRSWCPVLDGWDDDKMSYCVGRWREITGGGGKLLLLNETGTPREECSGEYYKDEVVKTPILFSQGPSLFTFGLTSHQETLDMLEETRSFCDNNPELHCWMTGIPFDYWSQYVGIFDILIQLGAASVGIGFFVSFVFLYLKLTFEANHPQGKIVVGSLVSALLIAITTLISLVTVTGLSFLADVSLTGFSNMSFVLSVGFAVEYAVHVISRWLRSDLSIKGAIERVEYTMSFLMLPTFMSFVSSVIGIACLAFTDFEFNKVFFFRPLMIVVVVTYYFGCWWLPCVLTLINFDSLKLGKRRRGDVLSSVHATTAAEPSALQFGENSEIPSTKPPRKENSASSDEEIVEKY